MHSLRTARGETHVRPETRTVTGETRAWYRTIAPWVFWPSVAIIGAFVLWAIIWDDAANRAVMALNSDVVGNLGWYYMVLVSLFVIFVVWVGLSRFGDIKLGKDDDKPDFSTASCWRCSSPPAWASAWSTGASPSR